jgi:hypothetical protein
MNLSSISVCPSSEIYNRLDGKNNELEVELDRVDDVFKVELNDGIDDMFKVELDEVVEGEVWMEISK